MHSKKAVKTLEFVLPVSLLSIIIQELAALMPPDPAKRFRPKGTVS